MFIPLVLAAGALWLFHKSQQPSRVLSLPLAASSPAVRRQPGEVVHLLAGVTYRIETVAPGLTAGQMSELEKLMASASFGRNISSIIVRPAMPPYVGKTAVVFNLKLEKPVSSPLTVGKTASVGKVSIRPMTVPPTYAVIKATIHSIRRLDGKPIG